MGKDLLRAEPNQRVDLADFRYLANDAMQEQHRQGFGEFMTNPAGQRAWILDGFAITNPVAQQVQVTLGRAILSSREGGVVFSGNLTTSGTATRIIDAAGLATANYFIYIRFEYVEADSASRTFWDAQGLGSEFSQTVDTRLQANWSLRIETSSPGAEWFRIGKLDVVAGVLTLLHDERDLYFEGQRTYNVLGTADIGAQYPSGWSTEGGGSANDRSPDRNQYGAHDLQTFTAAMRQCIEDIKGRGLRRWWDKGIGGLNVGFDTDPVENRVAVGDVDFYLTNDSGPTGPTVLNFDATDYLRYTRTGDYYDFIIAGTDEVRIRPEGMIVANGLNVGFGTAALTPSAEQIRVGDVDFHIDYNSGNPRIQFAPTDAMRYDRASDRLQLFFSNSERFNFTSAGGIEFPGSEQVMAHGPGIGLISDLRDGTTPPGADGFRFGQGATAVKTAIETGSVPDAAIANNFLLFEITDGDNPTPDGQTIFANTGNDGKIDPAFIINGNGHINGGFHEAQDFGSGTVRWRTGYFQNFDKVVSDTYEFVNTQDVNVWLSPYGGTGDGGHASVASATHGIIMQDDEDYYLPLTVPRGASLVPAGWGIYCQVFGSPGMGATMNAAYVERFWNSTSPGTPLIMSQGGLAFGDPPFTLVAGGSNQTPTDTQLAYLNFYLTGISGTVTSYVVYGIEMTVRLNSGPDITLGRY